MWPRRGRRQVLPECGADLAGVRDTFKGKAPGGPAEGAGRQGREAGRGAARDQGQGGSAAGRPAGGFSPAVIWGGFGVVAVVVIVVVVMLSGGFGGKPGASPTPSASAAPVMGLTTGSYKSLVSAANKFFDQGQTLIDAGNFNQGVYYFEAAAMTYASAWQKQSTDPAVGTDYASALFFQPRTMPPSSRPTR